MERTKDQNSCIRIDRNEQQIDRCKERISELSLPLSGTAQILALAGNEVRLKILFLLYEEQRLCVCDLSEVLEMKIPAVSQHLRKLKDAGLVFTQREGTVIFYQITNRSNPTLDVVLNLIPETTLP